MNENLKRHPNSNSFDYYSPCIYFLKKKKAKKSSPILSTILNHLSTLPNLVSL